MAMYHPACDLVGSVLLRKSSQDHGPQNIDTGRGVDDPHGIIDLLLMSHTLLRHVEQQGV